MPPDIYKSDQGQHLVEDGYREMLARWSIPNRQFHVPTRFGRTHVISCGVPGRLPPLVLFHGSGSNSAMWLGDMALWASSREIYAIDMIGEPGLSAPVRPALDSDEHFIWLTDVLAALHIDKFAALGVSLGGWLVLDYATRAPERVERLCVLSPGGIGRQRASFIFKVLPLLILGDWGVKKALRIAVGGNGTGEGHLVYMDFMALVQKSFKPRMQQLPIFADLTLSRLTMPLLAVLGAKDAILDSADTRRRLSRTLPDAQILYLPEVGHGIFGERAAISRFLGIGPAV
jgi:pimeloyl-ACP methyl ester carboxylesterase